MTKTARTVAVADRLARHWIRDDHRNPPDDRDACRWWRGLSADERACFDSHLDLLMWVCHRVRYLRREVA